MKFGILIAMHEELDQLLCKTTIIKKIKTSSLSFYLLEYGGSELIAVCSGIGKVNSALATAKLLDKFNVEFVFNLGIAGGLDTALAIGSVVIGTSIIHHDVDLTPFGYEIGQIPKMPTRFYSYPINVHYLNQLKNGEDFKIFTGEICSGDSFISSTEMKNKIIERFPNAYAIDMEAVSFAQVCYMSEISFACIKGISDTADPCSAVDSHNNVKLASKNAVNVLLSIIGHRINLIRQ